MKKNDCLFIGILTKTYGINGEFLLKLDSNIHSDDLIEPESVFVEIDNKLVPFFISSFAVRNHSDLIIKFNEIETESRNKLLKGKKVFINKEFVISDEKEDNIRNYLGYKVHDNSFGEIGVFNNILEYPGNPVMAIKKDNKEILLPLNEDFIEKIDHSSSTIFVNAPEGLIEIYL